MTTKRNYQLSEEQITQATDWVLIMSENPDIAQNAEFARWLSHSEGNRLAFNNVARTYGMTTTLAKSAKSTQKRSVSASALSPYFLLAASIALCCFFLLIQIQPSAEDLPTQTVFSTPTGEISSFKLADDSNLVLDTNSRAEASITDTIRQVQLKKGRVFVEVTREQSRQFTVEIGDTFAFTALGTAYSVEKEEVNWTLEVYEGTVGVASTLLSHPPVKAGWGLRYENRRIHRYPLPDTLVDAKPDWQQHRIVFDNTSLRDAVIQFNRYLDKPLMINDPELASLSVSGTFDLNDSQAFMKSIAQITGATIDDKGNHIQLKKNDIIPES